MDALNIVLLIGFFVASYQTGSAVVSTLSENPRGIARNVSSVILGFFVSVWAVYVFSIIFHNQTAALVLFDIAGLIILMKQKRFPGISFVDGIVLVGCVAVSWFLMFKAFHAGPDGTLLVGTNEVFDFGHALSVIRSFSHGANIPYSSPFIAGSPHVYHFLFYYWVGILERFGLPIVYAFNVPSILALSGLLFVVYTLARYFYKSITSGVLAIYFVLTSSTLMFWYFLRDHTVASIWQNASYYFAGPYDGSIISIFWTLNVFVNQRHLVFGLSVILVLYFIATQRKSNVIVLAVLCGLLVWWHTTLLLAAVLLIGGLYILQKQYKSGVLFVMLATAVAFVQIIPWIASLGAVRQLEGKQNLFYYFLSDDLASLLRYWFLNLGLAIITIPAGLYVLPKNKRVFFLPFFVLFFLANSVRFGSDITENHKFLNLVFVLCSILSAGWISWCMKKGKVGAIVSVVMIVLLSLSGIINFMVIKNDFQYPVADYGASDFMRWIRDETDSKSVFLSYQDIFDPIALAGRKTYFGFYGAKAYPERSAVAKSIYEATSSVALHNNSINYVVLPKWKKDDFHYAIDERYFRSQLPVAYEDDRHVVFDARNLIE